MEIRSPAAPQDAAADTIAIAREGGLPLWCDDMALRQRARLRGIPAFSILDLITELTRQGTPLNPRSALRRLAGHYVVDLPLDADDIIELAASGDWRPGPVHTALARPAWWQAQDTGWLGTWLPVAAGARGRQRPHRRDDPEITVHQGSGALADRSIPLSVLNLITG